MEISEGMALQSSEDRVTMESDKIGRVREADEMKIAQHFSAGFKSKLQMSP